ncbi:J domain-containing protein [Candidatus Woesearchaeota archaeon]|nr:J domain-containing protein [Candidatus Woesearchaeota archaeon]
MAKLKIKGHEFDAVAARDSFHRRAVQYSNKIIETLRKIGLTEDDIDVPVEAAAMKKSPASATWYLEGYRLHYSYGAGERFVDNLYVVFKVIGLEVAALLNGEKSINDFIGEFSEDKDVKKQREEARDVLGIKHDVTDMEVIDKKYKELARQHHPDMEGGNTDTFKAINRAHKILRRELQ